MPNIKSQQKKDFKNKRNKMYNYNLERTKNVKYKNKAKNNLNKYKNNKKKLI